MHFSLILCVQYLHTTLGNVAGTDAPNLVNVGIIQVDDAASVGLDTMAMGFSVYLMVMSLYNGLQLLLLLYRIVFI